MGWTEPKTWGSEALTAADLNTYLRDNMMLATPNLAERLGGYFVSTGENSLAERQLLMRAVNDEFTTTSTSFVEDSTNGRSITFEHSGSFLVLFGARIIGDGTGVACCSPASEEQPAQQKYGVRAAGSLGDMVRATSHRLFQNETPGETTVTLQYLTSAGTASFAQRVLLVIPF